MPLTQNQWIDEYKKKGALWIHDGNKKRPHALLTSGKHSNGFFNSRLVIPDEALLSDAASDLTAFFLQEGGDISEIEGVVGPQTGATKLAELISDSVMILSRKRCLWASPAKSEKGGVKSMVFLEEEIDMLRGKYVLVCEDVLTTGESVELTVDAIDSKGSAAAPFILVLVNRSGLTDVCDRSIVSLIDHPMPMWTPEECPLCKEGSKALRPKDNWVELNSEY